MSSPDLRQSDAPLDEQLRVDCTSAQLKRLDRAVEESAYPNRSEAIRQELRRFIARELDDIDRGDGLATDGGPGHGSAVVAQIRAAEREGTLPPSIDPPRTATARDWDPTADRRVCTDCGAHLSHDYARVTDREKCVDCAQPWGVDR